jgi:hypothetical protein
MENLRLTPQEMVLETPGFSVLRADTAEAAAQQMLDAFPGAAQLLEKAAIVGSTSSHRLHAALLRQSGSLDVNRCQQRFSCLPRIL